MNKLLNDLEIATNRTRTENGALSNKSTLSKVLDLFSLPNYRIRGTSCILDSYNEDKVLTLKALLHVRDIEKGKGERQFFRDSIVYLCIAGKISVEEVVGILKHAVLHNICRWDDVIFILDKLPKGLESIKAFLLSNIENTLLSKWMPSINASSKETIALANRVRKVLGLTAKEYRQLLSKNRARLSLIEAKITNRQYGDINYSHVPSRANLKYKKAFLRNDEVRYINHIESVLEGKSKMNTSKLFPHEILGDGTDVDELCSRGLTEVHEAMWSQLPNYLNEETKETLVICDTSGSMEGLPMLIALSLSIYIGQRSGYNAMITFSRHPSFVRWDKDDTLASIIDKVPNIVENTNLLGVFELLLTLENTPKQVLIVSDMEFDAGVDYNSTTLQVVKEMYLLAEKEIPKLIFWNVSGKNRVYPATHKETGSVLLSGYSPSILMNALSGSTPYEYMLDVLNSDRYSF